MSPDGKVMSRLAKQASPSQRLKGSDAAFQISSQCGPSVGEAQLDTLPVFDLGGLPKVLLEQACTRAFALEVLAALQGEAPVELATEMARCLRDTGCLVVRDPRVNAQDNQVFLDLMERYFEQPYEAKLQDARPAFHYQVGVTPEGIEVPRCTMDPTCVASVHQQPLEHRPTLPTGPDPKWRYFWRIGDRPADTDFAELNAEPVVPAGFPEWPEVMDNWGSKMLSTLHTTAQLVAIGLGLPQTALTALMDRGPHLLGPTGIDLGRHRLPKTSFAGFHYDLNLLTIHGKSRFPGLFIWLADGRRVPVRIPDGCLLLQAGKQLEWLTAGVVKAGMHEVVSSEALDEAVAKAQSEGRSLWRVSSTVFGHVASDRILRPLGAFAHLPSAQQYPAIKAGAYVEQELSIIALKG